MKKTKTIGLAGVILAAVVVSPVVMAADTVALYQGPYSYYVGGEFTAVANPSLDANYASTTLENSSGGVGFQTFCVQTTVTFYPGTTYDYSVGLRSAGSSDVYNLSQGAAWLYSQFAQGRLGQYDYANTGTGTSLTSPGLTATRQTDAGALQAAIWYLQGDQTYYGYPTGGPGNVYYNEALAALGSANVDAAATGSANDYGVNILILTTVGDPSQVDQNQLVYTGGGSGGSTQSTTPDSGATLALMALSLAGLAVFARRLSAVRQTL